MITWMVYGRIQEHKKKGFNKSQTSRMLAIDYKTILKYWDMKPEEFTAKVEYSSTRIKKAEVYEEFVVSALKKYPDISAAQLYDWIKEKYETDNLAFKERTFRNFVAEIREKYEIRKQINFRQYEALDDPPFGEQAQVDMGEIILKTNLGKLKKMYCFALVLSNSRFKFVYWQEKPFTSESFVYAHLKAFEFLGGRTKEIVYDQDKILAVSENSGDIIYTEIFQSFINEMKFSIYLCRKSDPESKGKIEAVVKYAKNNFAKNRIFTDLDSFNNDCLAWLHRTGNRKIHETTKKIPKEVFALEKQYLIPVPKLKFTYPVNKNISYPIRKDNIILYKSNRYRVPKGTYQPGKRVYMVVKEDQVSITDVETGEIYATHPLCYGKGELIGQKRDDRDMNLSLKTLEERVILLFKDQNDIKKFLKVIYQEKPRYYRDQLGVIKKLFEKEAQADLIYEALKYCLERSLYSAGDLKSALIYLKELNNPIAIKDKINLPGLPSKYRGLSPKIRDLKLYEEVMGGI